MSIWVTQVGVSGVTMHIRELCELARSYRDCLHDVLRVEYPRPSGRIFSYALIIRPPGIEGAWVPCCLRNTTDFSGEGSSGHREMEACLEDLGIQPKRLEGPDLPEESMQADFEEKEWVAKAVESMII